MIESANKKKESTRKDRHKNHMQIKQRIPGKENIPEGFSFKKKKCIHQLGCSSPPFGVYVFSFQEYHLRVVCF